MSATAPIAVAAIRSAAPPTRPRSRTGSPPPPPPSTNPDRGTDVANATSVARNRLVVRPVRQVRSKAPAPVDRCHTREQRHGRIKLPPSGTAVRRALPSFGVVGSRALEPNSTSENQHGAFFCQQLGAGRLHHRPPAARRHRGPARGARRRRPPLGVRLPVRDD